MALHTNLPIYKVAYDLLDVVTDLVKNMPRDKEGTYTGEAVSDAMQNLKDAAKPK